MGSQLTKVSVSSRLGPPCQGPGSISPQLHISTFQFRLVLYLCPILRPDFLLLNLQSCTDGFGSLPSVSACMGDKLSKVAERFSASTIPLISASTTPLISAFTPFFPFQLLQLFPFQLTEKAPAQTKMPDPVVVSASAKHTVLFIILDRFRVEI